MECDERSNRGIGCVIEVYRERGPGLREATCEQYRLADPFQRHEAEEQHPAFRSVILRALRVLRGAKEMKDEPDLSAYALRPA